MSWTNQEPPATDVLLAGWLVAANGVRIHFEVDRIEATKQRPAMFRATIGDLFNCREVLRQGSLEETLRGLSRFVETKTIKKSLA